jgi:hypothetical protein
MQCDKCGSEMHQTEKDTSSGRDIREYVCPQCGHSDWEDRGKALWQILSDAREEDEAARADLAPPSYPVQVSAELKQNGSPGSSRMGAATLIVHRVFSAVFGLVLAVAGLAAASYIQTDFKGGTLLSGAVGILVPGVLMLSAFYMAYRFLRFAATTKK